MLFASVLIPDEIGFYFRQEDFCSIALGAPKSPAIITTLPSLSFTITRSPGAANWLVSLSIPGCRDPSTDAAFHHAIEEPAVHGCHEGEEARRPRGPEKSCSHGRAKRIGTAEVVETQ